MYLRGKKGNDNIYKLLKFINNDITSVKSAQSFKIVFFEKLLCQDARRSMRPMLKYDLDIQCNTQGWTKGDLQL